MIQWNNRLEGLRMPSASDLKLERVRKFMPESRKKGLSLCRRRFRFLFRTLAAVGFVYQCYTFMEMYREYPAVVELEVEQPSVVELPAVTVCNINEIRSSVFCERYPKKCVTPESDTAFCKRFKEYCSLVNISKLVPKNNVVDFRNLSRYEQQVMGHRYKNLISRCTLETDENEVNCSDPILFPSKSFSDTVPFNCYMINSLTGKPNAKPRLVPVSTKIHLTLNLEVAEYHPSHLSRGAQLSIHTPYDMPSPVNEGFFLNMGRIYRMFVRLTDKNLLPAPYKSNCTDYITQWRANGGKGPVTEKMCQEKCKLEKSLDMYKCADYRIDFPHNETYCPDAIPDFTSMARKLCAGHCSSPCKMRKFEINVQEADSEGNRRLCSAKAVEDLSCALIVHVSFDNLELTTFTYKPRFEAMSILGMIGGYVGLWLGISILHVYDFLEVFFFRVVSHIRRSMIFRRRKKTNVFPILYVPSENAMLSSNSKK